MTRRNIGHSPAIRSGLTLLEVVASLVLTATVLLVSITASANLLRNSHTESSGIVADHLATQILDEVSTRHYRDPDTNVIFGREPDETGSDRTGFDDVDDYHGYSDSPPTHRNGTTIEGYDGWSIAVSVQRAEPSGTGIATVSDDNAPLRLITITCTSPTSETTERSLIVSDVPDDMNGSTDYEKWRRMTLTFTGDRSVIVAAPMHNYPEVTTN